jgi:hypothetical protein
MRLDQGRGPPPLAPDFCASCAKVATQRVVLVVSPRPRDSGFMRDNVETFDPSFKRRSDYFVTDEATNAIVLKRISLCVIPEIRKLFFTERYLLGCYAAEDEAHFRLHRDNGQPGWSIGDSPCRSPSTTIFEGGELLFPEYNQRRHKAPKGWAIVFPCAILHAVTRVTRGRGYAFLSFLFDEAGARIKVRVA